MVWKTEGILDVDEQFKWFRDAAFDGVGFHGAAGQHPHFAGIDPDRWTILDGKLYLNYNEKIQTEWLGDTAEFVQKADEYWPEWEAKLHSEGS